MARVARTADANRVIRNPEQAVDIAERMYGDDSIVLSEPRQSLLLLAESVLARVRASKDH